MSVLRAVFLALIFSASLDATVTVKVFTHKDISPFESLIVEQRQNSFSQFPYLMEQGIEFEKLYAALYTKCKDGALAVAYSDEDTIAGLLTGCSLESFDAEWIPFGCDTISDQLRASLNVAKNYYLGDVIVVEEYRGNRIADQLFKALEDHAKLLGFDTTSLITVIRNSDHPQMPKGYKSLVNLWERLGYTKSGQHIVYEWPTYQPNHSLQAQKNACDIWTKKIAE